MSSYYDLGYGVVTPTTASHPGRARNPSALGATGASLGAGVAVTGGVMLTGVIRAGIATALVQYLTPGKLSTQKLLTLFGVLSVADVVISGLGIAAVYGVGQAATGGASGVGQFAQTWQRERQVQGRRLAGTGGS